MDSNQNTQSTNIEMVPKSSEDDIYSNSNTAANPSNYIPQQYNNNPDFQSQNTPYNSNQSQPDPTNPNQQNTTSSCVPKFGKTALLVMFFIQIIFLLIEIIVLNS